MSAVDLIHRHTWFDDVTAANIAAIELEIDRRLYDQIVTVVIDNPANMHLEIYPALRLMESDSHDDSMKFNFSLPNLVVIERILVFHVDEKWFVHFEGGKIHFQRYRSSDMRSIRIDFVTHERIEE